MIDFIRRRSLPVLLFLACSCGQEEAPFASKPKEGQGNGPLKFTESQWRELVLKDPKRTAQQKEMLLAYFPRMAAEDKQEEADRKELVSPAPRGWKPLAAGRKLKYTLIPEKTMIRKGEVFRYRLEVQNIGREEVILIETPASFIKDGYMGSGCHSFYLTPPGGKEARLPGPFTLGMGGIQELTEFNFPDDWTEAQKHAEFERIKAAAGAEACLKLTLSPGETISSRPGPGAAYRFRELRTMYDFDRPGAYRLKLVCDDRPLPPPTEKEIQSMIKGGMSRERQIKHYQESLALHQGLIESNTVRFEVVP